MSKSMIGGRVVLSGGQSYKILDETNAYWICKGTQFLKNNPAITEILPPEKGDDEPKKKPTTKKKEKPEEPVKEQLSEGKE